MKHAFRNSFGAIGIVAVALLTIVIVTRFERPPIEAVQTGYRGTAMDQIYNPRSVAILASANVIPATLPPLGDAGPRAGAVYKNVQVLGGLSVGEFTRLMASITTWVAPQQGCAFCHNTANMADDGLFTKVVSRRMIQMVQHINANWKDHVGNVGVTCYTCHRGLNIPAQIWFTNPGPAHAGGLAEASTGMALASEAAGHSSLPYDPFTPFLQQDSNIRVEATQALPGTDLQSIKQTEWTYALMMHFSTALGVNCTYCHNTRSLRDWSQSSPQRVTAWYGIRMVRDLNNAYLLPLHDVWPANQLGPGGYPPELNCATCHNGVYKPLFGVNMLQGFPELQGPVAAASAAPAPAPAPAAPAKTP